MSRTRRALIAVPVAVAVAAVPAVLVTRGADAAAGRAEATLVTAAGRSIGTATFLTYPDLPLTDVRVQVNVPLGAPNLGEFHGFHIHANDDPSNGNGCQADPASPTDTWFDSADGHVRDPGQVHSDHVGDLDSVYLTESGHGRLRFFTDRLDLRRLEGRAVILHVDQDNFGNVPVGAGPEEYRPNSPAATTLTDDTGNAGDRFACGVIARRS